jgi:hypothetical protein
MKKNQDNIGDYAVFDGSGSTSLKFSKISTVTFNFKCRTQFGEKVALVGN